MIDLNDLISKSVALVVEQKLEKMTQEKTERMINDILNDVFSSYGDVAKLVKEKIKEGLDVNLEKFNLVEYNVMISEMINRNLIESVDKGCIEPIQAMIQNTIGLLNKKEIKLSEIINDFISASMEYHDEEYYGEISMFIEKNEKHRWTEVFVDIDPDVNRDKCKYSFIFDEKGYIFGLTDRSRYVDPFNKSNSSSPTELSRIHGIERILFRIYSAGVPVIVDVDQSDIYDLKTWSRDN